MTDLFKDALNSADVAFILTRPSLKTTNTSYTTHKQRHPNECVTACFRLLSPTEDFYEAPSEGLSFSEALLIAARFDLFLHPCLDLNNVPFRCVLFGMTNAPRNHAYLLHMHDGKVRALYDPATGTVFQGQDIPVLDWVHLALVYRPR